jgi:hypothetical protein
MSDEQPVPKRSIIEQFACWLPVGLWAVGGMVGGAASVLAVLANLKIMSSDRPAAVRYSLYLLTFAGAVALYIVGVTVLHLLFPGFFGRS